MKKFLLTFTTFCLLFLTNCSKDDDNDDTNQPPALTKEALAGNYKLTSVWVKTNLVPTEVEVTDQLDACERDDIYNLKTDFTYIYTDAGTKCTPPGDGDGTWALPGNDKIDLDGTRFDVVKWDGKELQISRQETDPTTQQQATVRLVFTKQ
jgi:hypothetical protein